MMVFHLVCVFSPCVYPYNDTVFDSLYLTYKEMSRKLGPLTFNLKYAINNKSPTRTPSNKVNSTQLVHALFVEPHSF